MVAFTIRRSIQAIIVLAIVGLVAFSMFRFVGDPIDNMLGQERTDADITRLRAKLGLDQPFPIQYLKFLQGAFTGNFGDNIENRPALPITHAEITFKGAL